MMSVRGEVMVDVGRNLLDAGLSAKEISYLPGVRGLPFTEGPRPRRMC
jgi:hypothetical protein